MKMQLKSVIRYSCAVFDAATGALVHQRPYKRNLIPDSALARMASETPATFGFSGSGPGTFWVGTGTTPVRRDSGSITFTTSGSTVTASADFFVAGDSTRILKLAGGAELRLTYVNGTSCTFTGAGSGTNETGTIWYVDRTGLTVPVKYSQTSVPNSPPTSSHVPGTWTWQISRLFTEESATVTYTEVGWFQEARLLGLDAIPGGIQILAGQQLAIYLQVSMEYEYGSAAEYISIPGWEVAATKGVITAAGHFSGLDCLAFSHTPAAIPTTLPLEEQGFNYFFRSLSPSVNVDTTVNRRRYTWVIPVDVGELSNIQSIGLGQSHYYYGIRCVYVWNLATPMVKSATHRLTLSFDVYYTRTLVN